MSSKLFKSKHYPNLFLSSESENFFFRKFAKEKGKQFFRSTGVKNNGRNESTAYKAGLALFNAWLDRVSDDQGVVLFGRYAKRYLKVKLANPKLARKTKATFRNQFEPTNRPAEDRARPRLLEAFGHLRIEQINNDVWKRWMIEFWETHPSFRFFNARKALLEVLNNAYEAGYINRVPKLELLDPEAAPPRELSRDEIRKLFKAVHFVQKSGARGRATRIRTDSRGLPLRRKGWIKLLMLIIWKQGARPGEILQYEWPMFRFDEGPHGKLHIPARITKTRRARAILLNRQVARMLRFLQGKTQGAIFLFPSGGDPLKPIAEYQKAWEQVCGRAGLDAQIYWFRDTFVSRKLKEGVSSVFIAKYLDTSVSMIERKYAVAGDEAQEKVAR